MISFLFLVYCFIWDSSSFGLPGWILPTGALACLAMLYALSRNNGQIKEIIHFCTLKSILTTTTNHPINSFWFKRSQYDISIYYSLLTVYYERFCVVSVLFLICFQVNPDWQLVFNLAFLLIGFWIQSKFVYFNSSSEMSIIPLAQTFHNFWRIFYLKLILDLYKAVHHLENWEDFSW